MRGLFEKIKNMVRFGRVSNPGSDSGDFPQSQTEYMKKVKDVVYIYPYGMSANAPLDELAIVINVGHEDNAVAISASGKSRPKNLKPGEAVFGNFSKGNIAKFDASGNITITALSNVTVNAPSGAIVNGDTTVNGNATVDGNTTITGDLQVDGNITTDGDIDAGGDITTITGDVTAVNVVGTTGVSAGGKDFATHVHSGVTVGAANTGPPV